MLRKKIVSFLALMPLLCCIANAQITGGIRGTVSDASGAAVPKGTVTLTSLETKQVRTQPLNERGEFSFDLLTVGMYEVKVESPGFAATAAQSPVRTGEVSSLAFKLEVGRVSETVQVSDAVAQA